MHSLQMLTLPPSAPQMPAAQPPALMTYVQGSTQQLGSSTDESQKSDDVVATAPASAVPLGVAQPPTAPVERSVADMVRHMQAQLANGKAMNRPAAAPLGVVKRPAAAPLESGVVKRPAAAPSAGLVLGCSKCRWGHTGCSQCKKADYGGKRGNG
jgi:hypothetical protein